MQINVSVRMQNVESCLNRPIRLTQCGTQWLRYFVHCICIIRWHLLLNDMEIPETKRFIPKGFESGTTLSLAWVALGKPQPEKFSPTEEGRIRGS